ncbi:hypothetical protein COO60DRAFT_1109011 [Scenedesmus sp. NREL 46B-D3]|nr:hypothetical protein COO60DRAFT_1109011 [Scenedesmus sp. NREL 46B-D3]
MRLGSQLSGDELLQLLHQAAQHGSNGSAVYALTQLKPAAHEIGDLEGVAAFLQAAMHSGLGVTQMEIVAKGLPAVAKLAPAVVAGFIRQWIHGGVECLYSFLVDHPAVTSFSTGMLEQLLLEVVQRKQQHPRCDQHLADLRPLLRAPGAAGLPVTTLAALLQHAVAEQRHQCDQEPCYTYSQMQAQLLALPAMQQLPADAVAACLKGAVKAGNAAAVRGMCALPAVHQASKHAGAQLHLLAMQHGHFNVARQLLQLLRLPQHPRLELSSQQLQQLLLRAITARNSEDIIMLC